MSVYADPNRKGLVVIEPADGPIGKYYVRREPVGSDAGNVVVLKGNYHEELRGGGERTSLVISSATYAAIPDAWDDVDALFSVEDFVAEYRELSGAEQAVLAVEQAAEAAAATKAAAKRQSPWSRS